LTNYGPAKQAFDLYVAAIVWLKRSRETIAEYREIEGIRVPNCFYQNISPKLVMGFFQLPDFHIKTWSCQLHLVPHILRKKGPTSL